MAKPKFYSVYDHYKDAPLDFTKVEGMTDPSFKDDCDINHILKRFRAGQLPPSSANVGAFGDFSDIGDFQAQMDRVVAAREAFAALPSSLRSRFGNSPEALVKFVLDKSNEEECIKLGLRVRPKKEDTAVDVLKRIEKGVTAPAASPVQSGEGNAPKNT